MGMWVVSGKCVRMWRNAEVSRRWLASEVPAMMWVVVWISRLNAWALVTWRVNRRMSFLGRYDLWLAADSDGVYFGDMGRVSKAS